MELLHYIPRVVLMSEKRFELVSVCGDFGIIDTITDDVWFFETYESVVKVVDLLNELNDERMMYKTTIDKRIVELEGEVKSLNAFLVHKGFAEEYILWKLEVDV